MHTACRAKVKLPQPTKNHFLLGGFPMVSKCANPACSASFRYLRSGKLFEFEVSEDKAHAATAMAAARKASRHVEYFWLCAECASEMTLAAGKDGGVVFLPITKPVLRAAAAS